MRKLSLWLSLLLLGGIGYVAWPEAPAPTAEPVRVSTPVKAVPFLVKAKTRQIFDEWEKLAAAKSAGDRQASWTKINLAIDAIRQRLHADGLFASGAANDAMHSAARELGYQGRNISHVIGVVLEGDQSQQTKGSTIAGAIEQVAGAVRQTTPETGAEH